MSRRNLNNRNARQLPHQQSQPPAPSEQPSAASKVNGFQQLTSLSYSKVYSGPIPSPELLAQYDEVVPGSAELIVGQFIKQGDHRIEIEKLAIQAAIQRSKWGLIAGFVLALVTIAGSFYMMFLGKETVGFAGILLAIGSLAGTFVYGTLSQRKEREEKEKLRQELVK